MYVIEFLKQSTAIFKHEIPIKLFIPKMDSSLVMRRHDSCKDNPHNLIRSCETQWTIGHQVCIVSVWFTTENFKIGLFSHCTFLKLKRSVVCPMVCSLCFLTQINIVLCPFFYFYNQYYLNKFTVYSGWFSHCTFMRLERSVVFSMVCSLFFSKQWNIVLCSFFHVYSQYVHIFFIPLKTYTTNY